MSGAVEQLIARLPDHAVALVQAAADLTVTETQAKMSRRSGAMVNATTHTPPTASDTFATCDISVGVDYAAAANAGTGIYGPTGQRIFPRTAKALRFDWPAAGGIVFAKSVAGAPGEHFWDDLPTRWHDALAQVLGTVPL